MSCSIKQIINLFGIDPNYMVEKDNAKRWINALLYLQNYDLSEIKTALEEIDNRTEVTNKSPYYYLEAVRRHFIDKHHEELKNMGVSASIKEILRGMQL